MKCTEVEDKIMYYLEGDLSGEEKNSFLQHVAECTSCSLLLEQHRALAGMIGNLPRETPPESLRQSFEQMLQEEQQRSSRPSKRFFLPAGLNKALRVAASFLLLAAGYWLGTYRQQQQAAVQIGELKEQSRELKTEITLAMLDNRSASKRIQAVSYTEEIGQPDNKVLQAIIARLQYDENVNVRLAAVEALWRFKDKSSVRDALILSLGTEKSPDVQIAVIQVLAETQDRRAIKPMQKLLKEPETPGYVKQQLNYGLTRIL